MLITLLILFVLPLYYYGLRVLLMLIFGAATSLLLDLIYHRLFQKRWYYDAYTMVTVMICTLLISAAAPYYVVVAAVAFALLIAKYPFGSTGKNIFNPAAAGLCFVGFCWPDQVFSYPEPLSSLPLWGSTFHAAISPSESMSLGSIPSIEPMDLVLGKFAGPLGSTAAVIILACFIFLLVRKTISIYAPLMTIVTMTLFLILFPRVPSARLEVLLPEWIMSIYLFVVVFMATDPTTTPKTVIGQICFGALLGFLGWVFKCYGVNDYNFLYALLLCNAFARPFDQMAVRMLQKQGIGIDKNRGELNG